MEQVMVCYAEGMEKQVEVLFEHDNGERESIYTLGNMPSPGLTAIEAANALACAIAQRHPGCRLWCATEEE